MEKNKVTTTEQHEIGFSRKSKIMSRVTRCRKRGRTGDKEIGSVQGKSGQGSIHIREEASNGISESTQTRLDKFLIRAEAEARQKPGDKLY